MGIELKNPLIVASSPLSSTTDKIKRCEDAGAAAVVIKSLFEEQINNERQTMLSNMDFGVHADAYAYLNQASTEFCIDEYVSIVEKALKSVSIPVIPSINCISSGKWLDYAKRFEDIGCQALEVNLFFLPANIKQTSAEIEKNYLEIAKELKKRLSIPVSLKLGVHFTALGKMLYDLSDLIGIDSFVLFNRFYRHNIDIDKIKLVDGSILSHQNEMEQSLQWISLLSGAVKADFVGATGIHTSESVIKQLLVGAKAVQLCSTLIENGLPQISKILTEIGTWMDQHQYKTISDFSGILSQNKSANPAEYERVQYVKSLINIK